jgi:hypothetical protein
LAGLKSDKAALESALYETQQLNSQLEVRKEQLESENQELILKKENLQGNNMQCRRQEGKRAVFPPSSCFAP